MKKSPFWTIYSYWVLAMTLLWLAGGLPFSPLVSALASFAGSLFLMARTGSFNDANVFILMIHLVPLWILRNTTLDLGENVGVFVGYNIFLMIMGTSYVEVYRRIMEDPPRTIKEYLDMRF